MRHLGSAILCLVCLAVAIAVPAFAQTRPAVPDTAVPRLADGRPDLQGVWDFRTITPLQRPLDLGEKAFLTEPPRPAMSGHTTNFGSTRVPTSSRGVGALIQRGGRAVAGMLTIATAGGS